MGRARRCGRAAENGARADASRGPGFPARAPCRIQGSERPRGRREGRAAAQRETRLPLGSRARGGSARRRTVMSDAVHPGAGRDPATIERYQRLLEIYASYYRPEVRGFESLPKSGPFLVVGNHSGGATPPDMPILLTAWWRQRGVEEPVYGLFHSFLLGLPGVRAPLTKFGAIEAGWDASAAVLRSGGIVVVYPGGDHEAFRPFNKRNEIDFAGRTGFIK